MCSSATPRTQINRAGRKVRCAVTVGVRLFTAARAGFFGGGYKRQSDTEGDLDSEGVARLRRPRCHIVGRAASCADARRRSRPRARRREITLNAAYRISMPSSGCSPILPPHSYHLCMYTGHQVERLFVATLP